jgi:hypothetical protein
VKNTRLALPTFFHLSLREFALTSMVFQNNSALHRFTSSKTINKTCRLLSSEHIYTVFGFVLEAF